MYNVSQFPVVIDPLAGGLEVRVAGPGAAPAVWTQLVRSTPAHDSLPFGRGTDMAHFFGPSTVFDECPFLLVYDATGYLRYKLDREDGEFVARSVPEEVTGRRTLKPSVRLTFESEADASAFATVIHGVRSGNPLTPEECQILAEVLHNGEEVRLAAVAV